jgi:hypothetical protein
MEFAWTLKHFAQDELADEFVGSNQAPATISWSKAGIRDSGLLRAKSSSGVHLPVFAFDAMCVSFEKWTS